MAFQTMKPFSSLVTIFKITLFILLLSSSKVNSSSSEELSFIFHTFSTDQQNLIFQGNASISSSGKLQLTKLLPNGNPQPDSIGRALFSSPVRLWDRSTGAEASFATFFSFVVSAPNVNALGDGLAFFIAPVDTQPQAGGGLLGLFRDRFTRPRNHLIAVEFDTFHNNNWDIDAIPHIGINVNGIESIRAVGTGSFRNGVLATVLVTYDPFQKSLVASLVYPDLKLSYVVFANVSVRAIVTEWVRVGFTATTSGVNVETHDILSWSFRSKLPAGDNKVLALTTTSLHHDHMNNQLSSF